MKIKDVICTLESFAPLPLQDSYDNAGLQVGLTEAEVSGVLLCLDVTEEVIAEAVDLECNLIVSHHPLLFRSLKRVSDETQVERCVRLAVKHDITLYAMHTNLDSAIDGVNYMIAERLGLVDVELMRSHHVSVTNAQGTQDVKAGCGIMGYLPEEEDSLAFLQRVKQAFGIECLMHNELLNRPIQCVALVGGAGEFMLEDAINAGADAFLTGEMSYHRYFGHEQEIQIAVMGHYQSEQYTSDLLMRLLEERFSPMAIFKTSINTNPIKYL